MQTLRTFDVIVVGAGHNGLVAALLLAQAGLDVVVIEEKAQVGGAAKTEYPFTKAPLLGTSTGAYLLGVMPPELLNKLGIRMPLIPRDPHYFLPTLDRRYLLFGSDHPKRWVNTIHQHADCPQETHVSSGNQTQRTYCRLPGQCSRHARAGR